MKKPTLRLRQVFEGPTHFKVVKPLGNPIKIAKQGLSPSLMGRLRKFARDGEVQEATEQDQKNAQDLAAESRSLDFDQVRTVPDAQVDLAPRTRSLQEIEESLAYLRGLEQNVTDAQPVDIVERPVAQPIEVIKSQSVPVKPERVVAGTLMGPPVPVAPVMKPTPAPVMSTDEEMLAGYQKDLELELSKAKPNLKEVKLLEDAIAQINEAIAGASATAAPVPEVASVDKSLAQIRTLIDKEMEKEDPDYKKLGSLAETYGRLNRPIETPTASVSVAPAPKVPTVAPAAAVAPTPAPVVAPAAAPVAPTPAVAVAPTAAVAAVSPPAAAKPSELTPEQLFNKRLADIGIDRAEYDKMSSLRKMQAQGLVRQAAALEAQTTADEEMVKGEIKAQQDIIDEEKKRLNTLETRANESRDLQKKILEEMDHLKNPQSYFASLGTLGSIGSALSLAAGAFASGMTGMPNYAMQIFNNAVEKDLELQKMKRDSLFARLRDAGHSVESAEEVVRASARLVASAQAGKLAAMTKLPKVKASLALEQAKLTNDAIMKMAQVAEIEARPGERAAEREERALRRKEIDARASAALEERRLAREQREELARQKRINEEQARLVLVGDDELELRDSKRGQMIRQELAGQTTALQSAFRLEELFKKGGYSIFDPRSNEYRAEAIAELPLLIESYPLGKGFRRAISKNAGEFLKEAMNKPTDAASFVKKIFLDRDPGVGVKSLREDFQRTYENSIRNYVKDPISDRTRKAIAREIQYAKEVGTASDAGSQNFTFSPLSAPATPPATPVGVPPGGMPTGMR
jgi:hypothetical protein